MGTMKRLDNKWIRKIIIIIVWLLVWQMVSFWVGNDILLVGPLETLRVLLVRMTQAEFWKACVGSMLRITLGFLAGMLCGIGLAIGSAASKLVEEILSPVMSLLKAVPVASFVVLFLIWWSSAWLATVISFCITLPNLYINTLAGMKSTDRKLLEMARVFGISKRDCIFYIYRPALKPFWDSGVCLAAGMSWKSGVAAEVIGLPQFAIGEQLYMSKIYLDTAGVLAWTIVVILLSVGFEWLVRKLWGIFCAWEPECKGIDRKVVSAERVLLKNIRKQYNGVYVINGLTAEYFPGQTYLFQSPSGSGKTTLFRLLAGLERPDEGEVLCGGQRIAYLFQEDRLCEEYSALKNVELITGDVSLAKKALLCLLEEEDMEKPCKELSGGMKRRVALVRTMMAKASIVLLDEPYNGLDEVNRQRVTQFVEENTKDSIVLMATHVK